MPKVSIIVPTYNRAHVISNTLDSILSQTVQDFEVIVVANGSTDNTELVISNYEDLRIKYIYQDGTGSPASPRNNAIKRAAGDYIAFCDDDDLWERTKLEKQLELLKDNTDCGLCYTKMKRFNNSREWINLNEEYANPNKKINILYNYRVPLSSVMVRREILQMVGGFDESKALAAVEDYELMLRIFKHTSFCCVPEYLVSYYSGDQRLTNTIYSGNFSKNIKYLKRLISVYNSVAHKKYYGYYSIIMPLLYQTYKVAKIIIYDFKQFLFQRFV